MANVKKFEIAGAVAAQTTKFSLRIDEDDDLCLEANGQLLAYIDQGTGKMKRIEYAEEDLAHTGLVFNSAGQIADEDAD